ncbi:MAG: nitroreductase family deazaflavin-dependent oxidoreductase [Acidimicrobiales bacterium]|nr:nitroreductase family deazaflavin-dependent oxidoreductase [Acidimicrobiales bacterium]
MVKRLLMALGALLVGVVLLLVVFLVGMRTKSPAVQTAVRKLNRRYMNPRQMKTAGTPGAYAGIIRHVGRRSGSEYETPVGPFATEGGFVIALPYGTSPDWLKNVLAAGSATLVTDGRTYEVHRPEIIPLTEVADALPDKERRNLRTFRVEQCLRVRRVEPDEAAEASADAGHGADRPSPPSEE